MQKLVVYLGISSVPESGRRGPKQIIGCLVHNTPSRGCRAYTATTQQRISLSLVDILFPSRGGKSMYSSDRQRLGRASLIRNKLTERLVETTQRFHLYLFTPLLSFFRSFFGNRFVETLRFVKFPPPSFNSKLRWKVVPLDKIDFTRDRYVFEGWMDG